MSERWLNSGRTRDGNTCLICSVGLLGELQVSYDGLKNVGTLEASWLVAEKSESSTTNTVSVSIYLADEAFASPVEGAVEGWLAVAGLKVEARKRPVLGSWFLRLGASLSAALGSGIAQDAALTAAHALDNRVVLYQDAQTTALLLQNLGPVLAALQPTGNAVIRAGALLIMKIDGTIRSSSSLHLSR